MLIFVYGTLKRGLSNSHYLSDAKFIAEAKTKDCYPLVNVDSPYPYLINDKGFGKYILGELYEINDQILANLDILEGYPKHYTRDNIEVLVDGKIIIAITYFLNKKLDYKAMELFESF